MSDIILWVFTAGTVVGFWLFFRKPHYGGIIPKYKYRITLDGHGKYRVRPVFTECGDETYFFSSKAFFMGNSYGSLEDAENAIAQHDKIWALSIEHTVKKV